MASQTNEFNWSRLDNTAKVFPAVSGLLSSNVFRFYVTLKEDINPEVLHRALLQTLEAIPAFQVKMRRGLFWYYFEQNLRTPSIRQEYDFPCAMLRPRETKGYLFEVTYFGNRINLEVFHALSDGIGCIRFLKVLIFYYLKFQYPGSITLDHPEEADVTLEELIEDGFKKYYTTEVEPEGTTLDYEKAFSIRGTLLPLGGLKLIEGTIPVAQILTRAKSYGATVTEYLVAELFYAIYKAQYEKTGGVDKPLKISVPVNLRGLFPTNTIKNFFMFIRIKVSFFHRVPSFEEVLEAVQKQMKEEITKEHMLARIRYQCELEKRYALRVIPRPIKNIFMRTVYKMGERGYTTSFSNLGIVTFPEELAPHIEGVGVVMAASRNNVMKLTALTSMGNMTLSFSSTILETEVQRMFFTRLSEAGLSVTIRQNDVGEV